MTSRVPFRWRRGLVAALRLWAGTVGAALLRWQRHRADFEGVNVCVAVASPAAQTGTGEAVRRELVAAHRRFASGQAFRELAEVTRRGGEVFARLEDGSDPPRPAVVALCAELPASSPPAPKLRCCTSLVGLQARPASVAAWPASRSVLQHRSGAANGVRSHPFRSERRERRRP